MESELLSHEMSDKIKHPLHPRHPLSLCQAELTDYYMCNACGSRVHGFCFRCSKCKFTLDDECYRLLSPTKSLDGDEHPIPQLHHSHSLILCDVVFDKNFSRPCHACRLSINDESSVYVCLQCKCLLHKSCGELRADNSILHPFHQHPLHLIQEDYSDYYASVYKEQQYCYGYTKPEKQNDSKCHACGNNEGYFFSCSECKFQLDLVCASLTPTKINLHEQDQIQPLGHRHPLILCDSNFDRCCSACTLPFDQGSVIYVCLECKILLHISCTGLPPKINHPFHPQHPLTLLSRNQHQSTDCKACGGTYFGCTYDCSDDCCDFTMHAKCASPSLVPTIWSELHEHPLAFFNKSEQDRSLCNACWDYITNRTAFFSCVYCGFNLHLHCNPTLPKTVKHECHLHRLAFTNSLVKDYPDEDEDGEFYCAICEERRNLLDSTYFCDDCHFVAHFDCVHHEVVRLQEEERTLAGKNPMDTKIFTSIDVVEEISTDEVAASNVSDIKGTEQEIITSSSSSERSWVYSARPELDEEIKMVREEVDARYRKITILEINLEKLQALHVKHYGPQNTGHKLDQSTEGEK